MAILNLRSYFLDTLVEVLGIKSGLGLTVQEAIDLLRRDPPDEGWWDGEPVEGLRLHLEEFEAVYVHLLHSAGGAADSRSAKAILFHYCREHEIDVPEENSFGDMLPAIMAAVGYVESALISYLHNGEALPEELASVPRFQDLMRQYALRDVMDDSFPEGRTWDGIVSLRNLFDSEDAPDQPDTHFDQRFIDYLNAQPGDITKMHWRQFEYLTGEFFRRRGYRVKIGPGRADGGIDVRVEKERIFAGPEVIIIQCRRKGDKYEVEIDEVKALWADILDEGAVCGIMATTTRLAKGARDYCQARQYRVRGAERDQVRQWLRAMTSHGETWQAPATRG